MIRLFFRNGPFDGGSADFDTGELRLPKRKHKGKKTCVKNRNPLPNEAYITFGEGSWWVWTYKRTRTITPYSAEYTLAGWVKVCDVESGNPIIFIAP